MRFPPSHFRLPGPSLPFTVCLALATLFGAADLRSQDTRLDVLIVYTPAVTDYYNGENGVEAQILATLEGSNQALEDSEANIFFNLVDARELQYVETDDLTTDLDRLETPDDGYLDEVHGLRDQFGADFVALMRRGTADFAGFANTLTDATGNTDAAFSVFSDKDALSSLVFAHELGHNLGLVHARSESGTPDGVFEFSHGYNFQGSDGQQYRTIMSIGGGERIPFFSNPRLSPSVVGVPIGVSEGESDSADAAKSINNIATEVEPYRAAQDEPPVFFAEPVDDSVVQGEDASFRTLVTGVPPLDLQWYEGPVGDTSQPVAGAESDTLTVENVQEARRFWLNATNGNGVTQSRAAEVYVVEPPASGIDQNLATVDTDTGFFVDDEQWQEMVAAEGYLETIRVELFRTDDQNVPPDLTFRLRDAQGGIVVKRSIAATDITTAGITDIDVSIERFVVPGATYRVELSSPTPPDPAESAILWGGDEVAGNPPSSISSNPNNGRPDFAFAVKGFGAPGETFTGWQRAQGITEAQDNRPGESVSGGGPTNLLRYAFGLDASGGQASAQTTVEPGGSGSSDLFFRYQLRRDMLDVAAKPQTSQNLIDWVDVQTSEIDERSISDPEVDFFEVAIPESQATTGGDGRGFFRLDLDASDLQLSE